MISATRRWIWFRFRGLGLVGKLIAIGVLFWAVAYLTGELGLRSLARGLGHDALTVGGVGLTVAIILHIWTRFTKPSRHDGWTKR